MKEIRSKETVRIMSDERYGNINVKGDLYCDINFESKIINVKGRVFSEHTIHCEEEFNVKGEVKANKLEANLIDIHGKVQVDNMSGVEIKIISSRNSRIKNIVGKTILIKNGTNKEENEKFMNMILKYLKIDLIYSEKDKDNTFLIDKIEGEKIEIENIEANEVKGENIFLTGKCKIKSVIYKNKVTISDETKVDNLIKK